MKPNCVEKIFFLKIPLFSRLESLYLNNTGVTTIGNNAFSGLTSLKVLDLSHNPLLKELKGTEFSSGLSHLQELRLDHCGLTYVNDVTFEPLVSLQVLRLDVNFLTSFPVWRLDRNIDLQSLSLSENVWSCECNFIAPFNNFLQSNIEIVSDYEQIQCVSENAVSPDHQLCMQESGKNEEKMTIIEESDIELVAILVPAVVSVVILVIGLLAVCVFRKHINKCLYER